MNLNFLFDDDDIIKDVRELSPGYEDHASNVWLVKTEKQEVIVRSSKMEEEPDNEFWWGCQKLFGINPRNVFELEKVNNKLRELTSLPIPKVLKKGELLAKQYVVVEKLEGTVIQSFIGQPTSVLQSLGEGLAKIHCHKRDYMGSPAGTFKVELDKYIPYLIESMSEMIKRFYSENEPIKNKFLDIKEQLLKVPSPNWTTFVLVDMDPTQFLSDGKVITGLVDTEAYVIAPREFDFIGLEYVLDEKSVIEFKKGYERLLKIPDLTACREPYRFLYRLLSVQGSVDIDKWLTYKTLF